MMIDKAIFTSSVLHLFVVLEETSNSEQVLNLRRVEFHTIGTLMKWQYKKCIDPGSAKNYMIVF